jgi:ribonucleoside-triphosphate reductase
VDVRQASYLVGLTGLDECVQHRTGHGLHQSEEAVDLALRLVAFMVEQCRTWSERLDLSCVLAQTTDAAVSHRFALIDLQEFPGPARAMVKQDPMTQDILYTPGMQLSAQGNLSPIERTRLEGQFHPYLAHDAITHVRMPDADTAPRSIVDFLRKVYYQTTCRRIALCA